MKPILFNTETVHGLLEDRKTVTRRVVKPQPEARLVPVEKDCYIYRGIPCGLDGMTNFAPYRPGDILYVRETWQHAYDLDGNEQPIEGTGRYLYAADDLPDPFGFWVNPDGTHRDSMPWRPSIHMPREAARIFLRVTDVRVERLQEITPEQIDAEGCKEFGYSVETGELMPSSPCYFSIVWNNTVKKADRARYGWDANPWVWIIEFERISREEALQMANQRRLSLEEREAVLVGQKHSLS